MIAVIFELEPREGAAQAYLDLAAGLVEELAMTPGFISVERYASLATPGRYLSLSFWRDEAAAQAWRNNRAHRAAQSAGRNGVLAQYRLRVAHVVRDYGMMDRAQAPDDSRAHHVSPPLMTA